MLEIAAVTPEADAVEEAVTCAHQVGIREEFVPALLILLQSKNHFRHEDIVGALQYARDPRSIDGLFEAIAVRHKYLDYDKFFGLARKCTWALADIGTDKAKARLEQIASSENSLIASYAQKRLDHWQDELRRKRA